MTFRVKAMVALAALALAGWLAAYLSINSRNLPPDLEAVAAKLSPHPAKPHGRVDYEQLEGQLAKLANRPEMAGLAIAVVEDGDVRFLRTYGYADSSTGARVTPQTLFRWASVSKTVTGTLAASLASDGTIDLQQPIASWQTTLRLPGGAERRTTLAQLLSHQTGLTAHAYDEKLEAGESPASIRLQLGAAPLRCQPGTCHTYQNVAFDAASEILGEAAQERFETAVTDRLFRPLGMASASYGMAGLTGGDDWARPHNKGEVFTSKESYWRVPAAAGVNSNIGDLARWMQALMGEQPEIVSPAMVRLIEAPLVDTRRVYSGTLAKALSQPHYGLGMRSFVYDGHKLIGHSGAVAGYRATMIFDPATRTGVVAMWNSNWGVPFRIPFAVLDSYHGRPDCGWLDVSKIPLPGAEPPAQSNSPRQAEKEDPCLTR